MINYETILSSYDDKLTLMQWLKKVEAALKDASATGFHVNKRGNATITFSIDFENGETLESEPLILQQGESVESGEIRNGHLFLTLTNGDELDCGSLFNGEIPSLNVRSLEVSGGLLLGDDANAAIGGDLVVHGLTEVENIKAYGDVETESLTAAGNEISAKKPVVEVMNGYSYQAKTKQYFALETIYAGACKNGNKATFVVFAKIRKEDLNAANSYAIGEFIIPSSLGNRLIPFSISGLNYVLKDEVINAFKEANIAPVPLYLMITKDSAQILNLYLYNTQALELNEDYYIRIETTFLLSENLAA